MLFSAAAAAGMTSAERGWQVTCHRGSERNGGTKKQQDRRVCADSSTESGTLIELRLFELRVACNTRWGQRNVLAVEQCLLVLGRHLAHPDDGLRARPAASVSAQGACKGRLVTPAWRRPADLETARARGVLRYIVDLQSRHEKKHVSVQTKGPNFRQVWASTRAYCSIYLAS